MSDIGYRDCSIDVLKFLAVFLIINSHMDALYVKYSMLATGGAIGDAIFLFASGYTLLLSKRNLGFCSWYKRRINRIYPSVFVCVVIGALLMQSSIIPLSTLWGGQFVVAIMVYYVLIYGIKRYAMRHIPYIFVLTGIVSLLVYVLWFPYKYEIGEKGMYGITTLYRWLPYFAFMLLGSWMGITHNKLKFRAVSDFAKMAICLVLFYGVQLAAKRWMFVAPYQIITILPLIGIVFYLYKWCHSSFWQKLYSKKVYHTVLMTISSLCLESYLIQHSVFTTKLNGIFPLNIPIMILLVLLVSFLCKCVSRLFIQTFSESEYDWKTIVKLY